MDRDRETSRRSVGEFLFDALIGTAICLAVVVFLKIIVPRVPKK